MVKEEPKKAINKTVDFNLYWLAHKGSGFDCYIALIFLPHWRSVVNLNKNGAGFVPLKIFNGYIDQNQEIPQYVHFRCGLLLIKDSLKKIGKK